MSNFDKIKCQNFEINLFLYNFNGEMLREKIKNPTCFFYIKTMAVFLTVNRLYSKNETVEILLSAKLVEEFEFSQLEVKHLNISTHILMQSNVSHENCHQFFSQIHFSSLRVISLPAKNSCSKKKRFLESKKHCFIICLH